MCVGVQVRIHTRRSTTTTSSKPRSRRCTLIRCVLVGVRSGWYVKASVNAELEGLTHDRSRTTTTTIALARSSKTSFAGNFAPLLVRASIKLSLSTPEKQMMVC